MKTIFFITVALAFVIAFVRYFENNSIFHPTSDVPVNPSSIGLPFEDIYFKASDGVMLNGWLIKSANSRLTFLHLHGNAGNLSHRLEKIALFHALGVNIFIIDYRGYGKSQGNPTEEGIYLDAQAAYDYLLTRSDIDKNHIIVYGDSLGGAVAADLATKRKCAGLIVDSTFSTAADISKTIFPFVPAWILKTKMDSSGKLKHVTIPKLFIHSVNDEIIPFRLGKKLFDAAAEPKEFLEITGGHNTNHIDSKEKWMKGIGNFIEKLYNSQQ